jgi:hypothetical protein
MGTKNNPGSFDCYSKALPDEPVFVLLARDPGFERLVMEWARDREFAVACGERPDTDLAMVEEAYKCARAGAEWRHKNNGAWRN